MTGVASICSSQLLDTNTLRSRVAELKNVEDNSGLGNEGAEKLQNNLADELESRINCILSEYSSHLWSFSSEDFDEILEQLRKELVEVESQNAVVKCEIEKLERSCVEDYAEIEHELEKLCCSLEIIESQAPEKAKENTETDAPSPAHYQTAFLDDSFSNFKMLEVSHQIQKSRTTLKSLQDLDHIFKRFELVEKIEDALTNVRLVEAEGNKIRLSFKTYIPYLDTILLQQDIENVIEPLEMNHELIIETVDGTCELKNVEIFPNDVYIGEIFDVANTFRQVNPTFPDSQTRSSLEFFVRRVLDRVAFSSLKQFVVKNANTSRHSFEYLDREDKIVAHLVGGVDAFINLPQGWPLSDQGLELISVKSTSQYSKEISLSFLCKIVQVANSLNQRVRHNIKSFADNIEEIIVQQTSAQLTSLAS
ncbi:RNA-directed DNA polymerase (reversetranscriptase)-related family protein [Striga asiatica]|uniref:RNA-directed DNA polymerase (Reversetranscriptase)-related family protein n=1 Tax=Striga asiatica TaxID=4170 RepID=A0A5A7PMW3_STRAF|nr:RNA-directed DNA polymerase (reversetranscriptase)-related family protein [Striga asiatica]